MPQGLPSVIPNQLIESVHINNIADRVIGRFATAPERDAAIPTPVVGMVCHVGATLYQYETGGWIVQPARNGVTVTQTGQAINAGVANYMTWNGESGDTSTFFTSGNPSIPTGLAGIYSLTTKIVASGAIVGTPSDVTIQTNVGSWVTQAYAAIPVGKMQASCAVTLPLAAGTLLAVQVYNGSSGSLFYSGELRIWRVSA